MCRFHSSHTDPLQSIQFADAFPEDTSVEDQLRFYQNLCEHIHEYFELEGTVSPALFSAIPLAADTDSVKRQFKDLVPAWLD